MKFKLVSALTIFAILGLSQQAKAYNIEACAKDPMIAQPETINLLKPIDQKMINCIPKLDSIASQWQSKANSILSAINVVKIGNQGENNIEKLEYIVRGSTVSLIAKVQAKHTWKETIPAVRTKVPVDKWRWVDVPYPDVRYEKKCKGSGKLKVCVKVPVPFTNHRREKVPYTEMEIRTVTPEKVVSTTASATCKYDYTFNLSTSEQKPVFNCGQGWTGNIKLDASAITKILNGEMPSLGSLISSISLTPPLFKDANRDTYDEVKNKIVAAHPGSIVYFSSQSFVNWASAENQGANVILSVLSGGGYGAELTRQIAEKLGTELTFMSVFASQTAINLGVEQIIAMMTGNSTQNLGGYNVSVKVVNTPSVIQKCIVNGGDCTPEIKSPRLGFAIIATKI
ncbi:MAG: hypothetical protein RMX68_009685 [Aulosira sp. ZfuVER01]|nr:hypothetical protein [Aulosira sp. ZfuVER01]MDZ8002845.1 hypothetical protein [Aulosira sp. DedVER01a]MDZ8050382.1 hypothetical protein [Aulosira sp. ZfuCHP01]